MFSYLVYFQPHGRGFYDAGENNGERSAVARAILGLYYSTLKHEGRENRKSAGSIAVLALARLFIPPVA